MNFDCTIERGIMEAAIYLFGVGMGLWLGWIFWRLPQLKYKDTP